MYIARFSYSIKPVDRERALALLGQEVEAARGQGLEAPAVELLRIAATTASARAQTKSAES